MKRTEEFSLINKQINSAKRFRKFEHISNRENDFIEIVYDCVYKISCKPLHKGSEIKTFWWSQKRILNLLEEVGIKQIFLKVFIKNQLKPEINKKRFLKALQ